MKKAPPSAALLAAATSVANKPRLNHAQQQEALTRDILGATWHLFREVGYEAVTMEGVAERAGITRITIYKRFGDKQNLFFELANLMAADLSRTLLTNLPAGASVRANLEQLAKVVVTQARSKESPGKDGVSLLHVVEMIAAGRPDIAAKQREAANRLIKEFADMIRASSLRPGDHLRTTPETIAALIIAVLNGISNVETHTGRYFAKATDLAALFHGLAFRSTK